MWAVEYQLKNTVSFRKRILTFAVFALTTSIAVSYNLECKFESTLWGNGVSGKQCTAKNVLITEPNQVITSVNGQAGLIDRDVKMIAIYSQLVKFLPKKLETYFPELTGIAVYGSKLKSIDKTDLKPFGKLRYLSVPSNDLETLSDDLFEFNLELRACEVFDNNLKFVGGNIFSNLKSLEMAQFRNNICISQDVYTPNGLPSLIQQLKKNCGSKVCQCNCKELEEENLKLKSKIAMLESKWNN